MESRLFDHLNLRVEKRTDNRQRDAFGENLEEWFGTKAVYGVYKKFGRDKAARAFHQMQKEKDHNWKNFMQRLHHG